ncbi:MAG: alpha-ketoglutarate-dependent taurine dioxygenase [Granulosicoccus sp.]|jgi:alpha-ketoglutarate-dependent taurine dioxygenase
MLGSIAESTSVSSCSMHGENLLERARRLCEIEPPARRWTRKSLTAAQNNLSYSLDSETHQRIDDAIVFARHNGLNADNIEQEDFRLPEFAKHISSLREQLDTGCGFVVIRNIPVNRYADDIDASEIIAWGLANYFGRPLRQGITTDRRMFSVTDQGSTNNDPTRIGASSKRSAMHSDNGCLEPRPPCYIALMCVESAAKGGESRLISARTLFSIIDQERPDLLPIYFEQFAFRSPQLHVWPSGKPYIHKPIFEISHNELRVHYARVMIEPGMEMAGTPLTSGQLEALDYLDTVLDRDVLCYQTQLESGHMLVINNVVMLHGREAFSPETGQHRLLKRIWMRRRHLTPGDDPMALDLEEFDQHEI